VRTTLTVPQVGELSGGGGAEQVEKGQCEPPNSPTLGGNLSSRRQQQVEKACEQ
jgi:hypothetical protein